MRAALADLLPTSFDLFPDFFIVCFFSLIFSPPSCTIREIWRGGPADAALKQSTSTFLYSRLFAHVSVSWAASLPLLSSIALFLLPSLSFSP